MDNLTVSFSDGRALCFLLHHYYPTFLQREDIAELTSVSAVQGATPPPTQPDCSPGDPFGNATFTYGKNPRQQDELLANEKRNFKVFYDKVRILIDSSCLSNHGIFL